MDNNPLSGPASRASEPFPTEVVHMPFSIRKQDGDILQQYIDQFQDAKTEDRADIIERAMAEIYALHPPNTLFDKMDASTVIGVSFGHL